MIANDILKKQKLLQFKEELQVQEAFHRINKLEDYREHLLPKLQAAATNLWVDPAKFPDQQAFFKAYTESYGRARAYQEIIDLLASSEARISAITKAMDPKEKFAI